MTNDKEGGIIQKTIEEAQSMAENNKSNKSSGGG